MEFEKIQKIAAGVLKLDLDEISMNIKLVDDLGADSLDIYRIITELEEEFDIELTQKEVDRMITVADIVEKVKSKIN